MSMMHMLRGDDVNTTSVDPCSGTVSVQPTICVNIPGGAAAYQIIISRNGKLLLINSADCALRLYNVEDVCEKYDVDSRRGNSQEDNPGSASDKQITKHVDNVRPRYVFHDNISKAPFASCDFSGDGEFVVGGCNSFPQPGDNYKLFLWNCITGDLVDQLTGPVSSLYSVSCHPTRPFIAVGTSDDIIDVWGSRIDWVAFAPDFQALQQNELYEEREDEFDIVDDEDAAGEGDHKKSSLADNQASTEEENVDIMTIDKIPAFDSDSEDESSVFYFDTKIVKILAEKRGI
jgi:WD40 repeat protein